MEKVELKAKMRDVFGKKTNKGRKSGLIPAVVYGRGVESVSLWVNTLDFRRLLKKSGESTMIGLEIDGKNGRNVIIYEIQRDPVTDSIIHIDFFQVRMDEEIETEVELEFIGEALAVRDLGGVLVRNMDEIEVKCLPGDLPSRINVDISVLNTFEDRICVKDLKIPEKVKIELDPETVVALVSAPRSEEELGKLDEKVEADVTKVEGVVKAEASVEAEGAPTEDKEIKEGKKKEKE
jgi:large subunit ribosomal protein L25